MKYIECLLSGAVVEGQQSSTKITQNNFSTFPKSNIGNELLEMLNSKNGFFAFSASLHVFPLNPTYETNLLSWNEKSLWKKDFLFDIPEFFCFAENLFGEQFCVIDNGISKFDPETGEFTPISTTVDGWAKLIIEDTDFLTGNSLGEEWQLQNGSLTIGCRLVPKIPFVCGGEYEIDNLISVEAVEGMRSRASFASQIQDLPDGAEIRFRFE